MESAGVLFVRTRGDVPVLTRSLLREEFNAVGLYWTTSVRSTDTPRRALILIDLARGVLRLTRRRGDEVVIVGDASSDSVGTVEDLLTHPDVERVACWPFHHPNVDRVFEVAYRWLAESGGTREFSEFAAKPRSPMDFLPHLRERGLQLDPSLEYPGMILKNDDAGDDATDALLSEVTTPGAAGRDGGSGNGSGVGRTVACNCEAIRVLSLGDLRVVQNSVLHTCPGCSRLDDLANALYTGEPVGHDRTRALLGPRFTGELARGALFYVRDEVREDLSSMLKSISEHLERGERPIVAVDALHRLARELRCDDIPEVMGDAGTATRCTHGHLSPLAPVSTCSVTLPAVLALPCGTGDPPRVRTPSVLHIPLLCSREDVRALDDEQLTEVIAYLSQKHLLRDERTSHLREQVDAEILERAASSS